MSKPTVAIRYCTGCRWLLRAAWMAQELLTTFEDDLAEVCFIAAALKTQSSNEVRELPADRQALQQDFDYALRCSETGIPVLVDKLSPSTRAFLRHALRGCACPVVPEGDAYYATDVIVALGQTRPGSE